MRCTLYPILAAFLASQGCNAGVVNTPLDDSLEDPMDPEDPGQPRVAPPPPGARGDARSLFETGVLPLLSAECGSCHADRTQTGPDFLLGTAYETLMGWNPALVVPGQPSASTLLTHGTHAGPAMSAGLAGAANAWVDAEAVVPPGGPPPGGGPPPPVGNNQPPLALFDVILDADPFRLSFDATRSSDADGTIVDYQWSYGDGQSGTGRNVTHVYPAPSTYAVRLTVFDDMGDSTVATEIIDVLDPLVERIIEITNVDDASVDSSAPDTNLGAEAALLIDGSPVFYETFIQPANIPIPAGSTVLSARLELTAFGPGAVADAHQVTAAWDDGTITFNARPTSEDVPFTSFTTAIGLVTVDVTAVMQQWVNNPATANGLRLRSDEADGSDFHSAEGAVAADRPRFVVTYR